MTKDNRRLASLYWRQLSSTLTCTAAARAILLLVPLAGAQQPSVTASSPATSKASTTVSSGTPVSDAPSLVFQTGFEGSSRVIVNAKNVPDFITPGYAIDRIAGKDKTLHGSNDWTRDLDGRNGRPDFLLEYTGGDDTKRYARVVPEPGNPRNHVLVFHIAEPWHASENQVKARVQADLYNMHPGLSEVYQSVRVFFPPEFALLRGFPHRFGWLTLAEFWNNAWWQKNEMHGFRLSLNVGKLVDGESDLHFMLTAEDKGHNLWADRKSPVAVPIGRWFTMEFYLKEGDADTGRFYLAITPEDGTRQVVYDHRGFTRNSTDPSPDGLSDYNAMKLYTSDGLVNYMKDHGSPLEVYWDDLRIWKNKRPE